MGCGLAQCARAGQQVMGNMAHSGTLCANPRRMLSRLQGMRGCAVLRRQVWVLFMMQGEQVVDNVGKVARVAVPMAAYFGILWTGTFLACRAAGVRYGHAVTQVRGVLLTCCLRILHCSTMHRAPHASCDRAHVCALLSLPYALIAVGASNAPTTVAGFARGCAVR